MNSVDGFIEVKSRREEMSSLLLILGISAIIFFSVFLFCSYIGRKSNGTLISIKDPKNSSSPSLLKIDMPRVSNVIPVQPLKVRR